MEKTFSLFGKIMLVVLVLGSLTFVGYYFGKKSKPAEVVTEEILESTATPLPTPQPLTTVVGGLNKSAGLSFEQYSLLVPNGWTFKKESQTPLDEKLILEKDGYVISIFQAATGGALCLYQGDPDFEGPSSKFKEFVALTTQDGKMLRRSLSSDAAVNTNFTVCQKSADNSYQQPTTYGHISIKTPEIPNAEILKEVDSIISSLKKI